MLDFLKRLAMAAMVVACGATRVEAGPNELAVDLLGSVNDVVTRIVAAPGDDTRLFICTRGGLVKILNWKTGQFNDEPFLDISDILTPITSEQGLCGFAFHPDYQANGRFFIYGTVPEGPILGDSVLFEGARDGDDPNLAEEDLVRILKIEQPMRFHQGGWMQFSVDGYLLIALGDGSTNLFTGPARAQDITDGRLLGKLLRIDVNGDDFPKDPERNYAIPPDNPFVGIEGDDEILAYGLRNPWTGSIDPQTGDIFLADVGHETLEEINVIVGGGAGENFGWRCMEGSQCTGVDVCTCNSKDLQLPIWERAHGSAGGNWCSIIGAEMYRGCTIPFLDGRIMTSDFCTREVWSVEWTLDGGVGEAVNHKQEILANSDISFFPAPTAFGHDNRGEVWIGGWSGEVMHLVPNVPVIRDGDLNCDGVVNVSDLLMVIGTWGPCDGCRTDIDGDHVVSVIEILLVIDNWG